MSFITDKRGFVGWLFLVLMLFILLVGIVIEYGRVAAIKRTVEDGLSKALNSSVQMAMLDEYRKDHISRIDITTATTEVYTYMADVLGLAAPAFVQGTLYRLENVTISATPEPPRMELSCTLVIPMAMFNSITGGLELRLPLTIASRNQRLE